MYSFSKLLLALSSFASLAYAAPVQEELEDRGLAKLLCALENPIFSAFGATASATAFCSSYLSIATQTFSTTVTDTISATATTTLSVGTHIITVPTSTSIVKSSVRTTSVVLTTVDNILPTATALAKRGVPAKLAKLEAKVLSSACSCLHIPTPSITKTKTKTRTVSLTLTVSTFASSKTITPVAYSTVITTYTALSTSTILKSDVISSIVSIVNHDGLQPLCSSILSYTTPRATSYKTVTNTIAVTARSTATVTSYTTLTTTSFPTLVRRLQTGGPLAEAPVPTLGSLSTFPVDYVKSACSQVVPPPATSIIPSTIIATATQTSLQILTATAKATSVITRICNKYPIANSGFETGNFNSWTTYAPISGAGGSWSVVSGGYNSNYAARVTMLNPDTSKYGGFAGIISQNFATCVGFTYTVSFAYDCTTFNNGLQIYAWAAGSALPQFSCQSQGAWYSKSFTFTAQDTSTTLYIESVQNGVTQGVILFDNVVVTLNQ